MSCHCLVSVGPEPFLAEIVQIRVSYFSVNKDMSHTCPEGYTIPSSLVCDGTRHCTDGSDENTCDHICPEGYSIPVELKCDNIPHCSDSSDEIGCPTSEGIENIPYPRIDGAHYPFFSNFLKFELSNSLWK